MVKSNDRCMIYLPSQTYAISAAKLLRLKGIGASEVKETDSKRGCINGVAVSCRDTAAAKQILISYSIPIS
ncbi:MAG: hypothetical protein IKT46_04165 [Clostridia bacterium]|nr:hypothetical protein [Clostridia bacterium]